MRRIPWPIWLGLIATLSFLIVLYFVPRARPTASRIFLGNHPRTDVLDVLPLPASAPWKQPIFATKQEAESSCGKDNIMRWSDRYTCGTGTALSLPGAQAPNLILYKTKAEAEKACGTDALPIHPQSERFSYMCPNAPSDTPMFDTW
jgi:hypothetical protein